MKEHICPVCGLNANAKVDLPIYNGYEMSQCPSCSFVYTTAREIPTSQYEAIYPAFYYSKLKAAEKTAKGEYGFKELWWFKRMVLKWLECETSKGKLLDVGCGPGTFMIVAQKMGWEVRGVEPTTVAADKAKSFGLNVYNGLVEDYVNKTLQTFDVITSFEVLEHVSSPIRMLQAMHSLLLPGGYLVISVPNLDDPYCLKQQNPSSMPPIHINFFNRKSLKTALETVGFEIIRFKSLPIPTGSVRGIYGKLGFLVRLPLLFLLSLLGKADGTALIVLARRKI